MHACTPTHATRSAPTLLPRDPRTHPKEPGSKRSKKKKAAGNNKRKARGIAADWRGPKSFQRLLEEVSKGPHASGQRRALLHACMNAVGKTCPLPVMYACHADLLRHSHPHSDYPEPPRGTADTGNNQHGGDVRPRVCWLRGGLRPWGFGFMGTGHPLPRPLCVLASGLAGWWC